MKLQPYVLALAVLVPSTALAGPISLSGTWSPTATASGSTSTEAALGVLPFWAGTSWDGPNLGVGHLINAYSTSGLEYLHDGTGDYTSFKFTDRIFDQTKIFGITAWNHGVLGQRDGTFTYDNGAGNVYNSWSDPGQFALFRLVGPDSIRYFLGVEDILIAEVLNDHDYNDYVVTFTTPQPVPEPGTLLLLGSGVAALVARRKVAGRKSVKEVQA